MTADSFALLAIVILLLPMAYLLLAAPAFLLVRLDIPQVARLLRGMFDAYYVALTIAGVFGTITFAIAGRPVFVVGIGLLLAFAIWARRWFLRQMDAQPPCNAEGARRMRQLHWGGMLCNAVQLGAILLSIPYVMVSAA